MPEASEDSMLLIAISYQALKRFEKSNPETIECDCIVTLLFAGFYIEAYLNYVIEYMAHTDKMRKFIGKHAGMRDKLTWFYNENIARKRAKKKSDPIWVDIRDRKLKRRFSGFEELCNIRNNLCHGEFKLNSINLNNTNKLRQCAKDIVDDLCAVAKRKGYEIKRLETYQNIISTRRLRSENALNLILQYPNFSTESSS